MKLNDFQQAALETFLLKNTPGAMYYLALGLGDEAGEVQGKIKKILRDQSGNVTDKNIADIKKELGDVMWYIACLADYFGLSLEQVAQTNIDKLSSRKDRGVLGGSGDDR